MKSFLDFDIWIGTGTSQSVEGGQFSTNGDSSLEPAVTVPISYPVQVFNSPAGPASGELILDLESPRFQQLLVLAQSDKPRPIERQVIGSLLFNALFSGPIRDVWSTSRGRVTAAPDVDGLRLRLSFLAPELASLPWELLWNDNFLATAADLAISRYFPVPEPPRLQPQDQVRILVVTASPSGAGQPSIPDEKVAELEETITSIGPVVSCKVLRNITREQLHSALSDKYHVLHYLGHGLQGRLLLETPNHMADWIDARSFAQLVYGRRELRMVVLNACGSGQATATGLFTALGPALVQRGVPAVVAMQYSTVLLSTATAFNRTFYGLLAKEYPVDLAVNEARQLLSSKGLPDRDWSTPVLYLGTREQRIIEFNSTSSTNRVADAWSAVRIAAESAGTAVDHQRVLQSMTELSTRFHELSGKIQNVAAIVNLSYLLTTLSAEYTPCREIASSGRTPLDQYSELKLGWERVRAGAMNDVMVSARAYPDAAFECVNQLATVAARIDDSLERRALKDFVSDCRKFGASLSLAQAEVRLVLKNATDELVSHSATTLGKFDAPTPPFLR